MLAVYVAGPMTTASAAPSVGKTSALSFSLLDMNALYFGTGQMISAAALPRKFTQDAKLFVHLGWKQFSQQEP